MLRLQTMGFAVFGVLALLAAGCTGTVVDPGGTGAGIAGGSTVTAGNAPWTPPVGALYAGGLPAVGGSEAVTMYHVDPDNGLATAGVQLQGWA